MRNANDTYTTAQKSTLVNLGITVGGSGAFDATIGSFRGGASLRKQTQTATAPTPNAPLGDDLLIWAIRSPRFPRPPRRAVDLVTRSVSEERKDALAHASGYYSRPYFPETD